MLDRTETQERPDMTDLKTRFDAQKAAFAAEPWPSLAVRRSRLDRLLALSRDHEADIVAAIDADFAGRSAHETRLAELFVIAGGNRPCQVASEALDSDATRADCAAFPAGA